MRFQYLNEFDPRTRRRKTIRLKGYDYSRQGAYFVTICTKNRESLFGNIIDGEVKLNQLGHIAYEMWVETSAKRSNVYLDSFVVMPNHIHGIIVIQYQSPCRGVLQYAPTKEPKNYNSVLRSPSQTIGSIIRGYKATVTKEVNERRRSFGDPVWQRNYYERIIRNQVEFDVLRQYIRGNPLCWNQDQENPANWNPY